MAEPETLRVGRYRIVSVLGRSHYATVYEAHATKSGDQVAVKVLSLAGTHRNVAEPFVRRRRGGVTVVNRSPWSSRAGGFDVRATMRDLARPTHGRRAGLRSGRSACVSARDVDLAASGATLGPGERRLAVGASVGALRDHTTHLPELARQGVVHLDGDA